MKILTIIGARPQFVKAAILSKALQKTQNITEIVVHTGQHFDANMSDVFFEQLQIKVPDYKLGINNLSHAYMTGQMMASIEEIIGVEKPDYLMVYGDTNSTLAGALTAAKMGVRVIHVEAGLRSFNMSMPEEINRILTDQVSSVLFCPTQTAVANLRAEGFEDPRRNKHIVLCGDVMMDMALTLKDNAMRPVTMPEDVRDGFILLTFHRQENTDDPDILSGIIDALDNIHKNVAPVICPLHPRSQKKIEELGLKPRFHIIEPVGYIEMLWLLDHSGLVITDSGGLQKEAYFMKKYCVTLREETEWVELVEHGFNKIVGREKLSIIKGVKAFYGRPSSFDVDLYGAGQSCNKIVTWLQRA